MLNLYFCIKILKYDNERMEYAKTNHMVDIIDRSIIQVNIDMRYNI